MRPYVVKQWKAKLKAAKAYQKRWLKQYNQAERALNKIGKTINELEKKIENELARP